MFGQRTRAVWEFPYEHWQTGDTQVFKSEVKPGAGESERLLLTCTTMTWHFYVKVSNFYSNSLRL